MFEKTNIIMTESGFINYEISNYAKNSKSCLHNLCYWLKGISESDPRIPNWLKGISRSDPRIPPEFL
jgi:hypothetical protein